MFNMGTIQNYWIWCDSKKDDPNFVKENAVQSYLAFRLHEQKRDFSTVNSHYLIFFLNLTSILELSHTKESS